MRNQQLIQSCILDDPHCAETTVADKSLDADKSTRNIDDYQGIGIMVESVVVPNASRHDFVQSESKYLVEKDIVPQSRTSRPLDVVAGE